MKSATTLTPRNAAAIAGYATLVGLTPEKFLNRCCLTNSGTTTAAPKATLPISHSKTGEKLNGSPPGCLSVTTRTTIPRATALKLGVVKSSRGKFRVVATEFVRGMKCQISE
jgi:hypothetical protein